AESLAPAFDRPLRVEHRGALFDVPMCEADGVGAAQAQVVTLDDGSWHVQVGAVDLFLRDASFDAPAAAAGSAGDAELRVPFNGKVVAVHAQPGDAVRKGDTLVIVESMKLEHVIAAARDGIVRSLHVQAGQQVAPAQLLVTLAQAA